MSRYNLEESQELHSVLTAVSGGISEGGEFSKSGTLPLDDPPPQIVLEGRRFLFTGTCIYGNRTKCLRAVTERGGITKSSVTLDLDYLVIGYYVTPSWKHQSFGNKIEKAMLCRDNPKSSLAIISEEHWMNALN